eukprot:CAMPEP_0201934416 /NCGR_PEP_ID=MMETSP0903-20130614/33588_1 /ASSEMBLY_ACC=CAM_ASM_000552 /TAXON_ID=420261 /ORGANISM="Thalassiosira antarctica, Strain CCMP982" /LENGTH=88 /DNA_ID=CAMNT_0048474627 /DNA_START=26 /DNA_END=289 /DNA_ORIENTATION=+
MAMMSSRTIFILCLIQVFLLCFISISFQLTAIHRIDESHKSNLLTTSHQHNNNVPSSSSSNIGIRPVIAYVVTLTGCGNDKRYSRDAA